LQDVTPFLQTFYYKQDNAGSNSGVIVFGRVMMPTSALNKGLVGLNKGFIWRDKEFIGSNKRSV
jgi:hypothetical protein